MGSEDHPHPLAPSPSPQPCSAQSCSLPVSCSHTLPSPVGIHTPWDQHRPLLFPPVDMSHLPASAALPRGKGMLQDPSFAYFCIRFLPGLSKATLSGRIPPLQPRRHPCHPCCVPKPLPHAPGLGWHHALQEEVQQEPHQLGRDPLPSASGTKMVGKTHGKALGHCLVPGAGKSTVPSRRGTRSQRCVP